MAKALRFVGSAWLFMVALLIVASCAYELWSLGFWDGLQKIQGWFSPFNIANYIVTVVVASPGLLCMWGADKLEVRSAN